MRKPGKGGLPLYATAEELDAKVDEFFLARIKENAPPTITGLCLYLGFCDRASFYDMEEKPHLSHAVKRARSRIIDVYERRLHTSQPTGAIFALKNFGWKDEQFVQGEGLNPILQIVAYGETKSDKK